MNLITLVATFSTVTLGGISLTGKLQDKPVPVPSKSKEVKVEVVSQAEIAPTPEANHAPPAAPRKPERGVFVVPQREILPTGVTLIK